MICQMRIFILFYFNLVLLLALDNNQTPRVVLHATDGEFMRYQFKEDHSYTVFLLPDDSKEMLYVGGHNKLFHIDFTSLNQSREIKFPSFKQECNKVDTCKNYITIMYKNNDSLFVCGTNGGAPLCCYMDKDKSGKCDSTRIYDGAGASPYSPREPVASLFVDDELYSTANRHSTRNQGGIRRCLGKKGSVWSDSPKTEQQYVGMTLSRRNGDGFQDKIYAFLREKNLDEHPEADLWISRVIQICRADLGGPKNILQKKWTSILSTRLLCGIPSEKIFFNRLLDVFVLHADDWRQSKVYALFSSRWNATAVCIYMMDEIDRVFTQSNIKGRTQSLPNPRPGTCVSDSTKLNMDVLNIIKDNPEMEDWVKPIDQTAPFMVSHRHYRQIQVDVVKRHANSSHTVLLMSLDNGAVHKVLEANGKPFIISEIYPFKKKTYIQSMILDSAKKKLYVGSSEEVVQIDLQRCDHYGKTCELCVLAQDPYCGWKGDKCTRITESAIQEVHHGNYSVCKQPLYQPQTSSNMPNAKSQATVEVTLSTRSYMSCQVQSRNAKYVWRHKENETECQVSNGECLYLIRNVAEENLGEYSCISQENGYEQQVAQYLLTRGGATTVSSRFLVLISVLLASLCF
ncbi:semaphorin-7A-like [Lepisosteus oculatus]|uniref:semaphorin-7A-like n=1 Tax=Lepisosteus oculatus TaxID=7918 RepID=UPI00371FF37A